MSMAGGRVNRVTPISHPGYLGRPRNPDLTRLIHREIALRPSLLAVSSLVHKEVMADKLLSRTVDNAIVGCPQEGAAPLELGAEPAVGRLRTHPGPGCKALCRPHFWLLVKSIKTCYFKHLASNACI